jgi:hypothetical protein
MAAYAEDGWILNCIIANRTLNLLAYTQRLKLEILLQSFLHPAVY